MTIYTFKVFKYYEFDAEDDTDALKQLSTGEAIDKMIPKDESPVLELFRYDDDCEHITIWEDES